jgi:hypothetical protein
VSLSKEVRICDLLETLELERRGWIVVDHWSADLCAVGIALGSDPSLLVYVSTFKKAEGRFDYECQGPGGADPEDYVVTEQGCDADLVQLLTVLCSHLVSGAPPAQSPG